MSEGEKEQPKGGSGESEPDRSVEPPTYDLLVEGGYGRVEISRKEDKSDKVEK